MLTTMQDERDRPAEACPPRGPERPGDELGPAPRRAHEAASYRSRNASSRSGSSMSMLCDRMARQDLEQWLDRPGQDGGETPTLDQLAPRGPGERRAPRSAGRREPDIDPLARAAAQLVDRPERDDRCRPAARRRGRRPAGPRSDVRREEDRRAGRARLAHQPEELVLHERIEPVRRLVEHEQLGFRRGTRAAARPCGGCPTRGPAAAGRGRGRAARRAPRARAASNPPRRRADRGDQLVTRLALGQPELARDVGDARANRHAVATRVEARGPRSVRRSDGAGRGCSGSSSSCPPRSDPGSRTPHRAGPRGRFPRTAWTWP